MSELGAAFALALAVVIAAPCLVNAQSLPEGSTEQSEDSEYEEVIVVVPRAPSALDALPLSVGVATIDPLADAAGVTLAEKLQTVAGVLARNRTNFAQDLRLSIRGFGARSPFGIRGIKVVLDGIPLTLADGLAQIDLVDPDTLGRIEVLRGPAGALYGNGSGGVIHLESADPRLHPGGDAALRVGGLGISKLSARAAHISEDATLSISASQLEQHGFRERSASLQRAVHVGGEVTLPRSITVAIRGAYLDAPIGEDPGALTRLELGGERSAAAPNNLRFATGESVRQGHVGAVVAAEVGDHETVEATLFYSARRFDGAIPFRFIELDRNAGGATATLRSEREPLGVKVRSSAAIELSVVRDQRTEFDNDGGAPTGTATLSQDEDVSALAAYGQLQLSPRRWLQVLAGVRGDSTRFELNDQLQADGDASGSRTLAATTSMVGVAIRPSLAGLDTLTIFANLANSFETPTLAELARSESDEAGLDPTLDAQRATNVELGARGRRGSLSFAVSGYATRLRDELVPFENESGRTFFRNAGRSNRVGLDLELKALVVRGLTVTVAYSAIRARFDRYTLGGDDFAGNAVPGIPPHRVGAALRWTGATNLFATLDYEYLRRTPANDAGTAHSFSQHVLGARTGMAGTHEGWRYQTFIGVANLNNTNHIDNLRINAFGERYFEPGWPIHAYLGLRIGWSNPLGI